MEILPLGPVVITDTPGLDDVGELGELRIGKAKEVLRKTDLAVLVIDSEKGFSDNDSEILKTITEKKISRKKTVKILMNSKIMKEIPMKIIRKIN